MTCMRGTDALLLALLGACTPGGAADGGAADGGAADGGAADGGAADGGAADGGADGGAPSGDISLGDAHNYSFHGVLDGPSVPLAELQDVTLSWSGLTHDLLCHDLDPVADIDNIALMIFPDLTEAEVEQGLADDSLSQVDLGAYLSFEPGDATDVSLTDLTFFGTDADIEEQFYEGHGAWLIALTTGTTIGVGARSIAFLTPTAGETATRGEITGGCDVLDATVDLQSLQPVPIAADGPWNIDWSALTTNMGGNPFDPLLVSEIMVARYDLDLPQLQEQFLDLELITDDLWLGPHAAGTSTDLSTLTRVTDGAAFPGFSADGTWLFALRCGTCANPAPLFLTVLEPGG